MVAGKEILFYRQNWDRPWGVTFHYGKDYPEPFISVFPNIETGEPSPTTAYIDWGNGDRDTIVSNLERGRGYFFTTEVWFNGKQVLGKNIEFPKPYFGTRPFIIVK